jgi:hypothetical protein
MPNQVGWRSARERKQINQDFFPYQQHRQMKFLHSCVCGNGAGVFMIRRRPRRGEDVVNGYQDKFI